MDLLPQAEEWVSKEGCRFSDLNEKWATELAEHLGLRRIPASSLVTIILRLVANHANLPPADLLSLKDADKEVPSIHADSMNGQFQVTHPAAPALHPPTVFAPGQTSSEQVLCSRHNKWRGKSNVTMSALAALAASRTSS
jgi:hypothetical protein